MKPRFRTEWLATMDPEFRRYERRWIMPSPWAILGTLAAFNFIAGFLQ
jgi:hypothetical protein